MAGDLGALKSLWDIIVQFDKSEEVNKSKQTQSMDLSETKLSTEFMFVLNVLEAISSLIAFNEELRKFIYEQDGHKLLLEFQKLSEDEIRIAAAHCLVSLGRADKYYKSKLIELGAVDTLSKLLTEPCEPLQIEILCILTNLGLEFPEEIYKNEGCFKHIIGFLNSMSKNLRYRSIFAIKNIIFKASWELKQKIISEIKLEKLIELLDDESEEMQIQSICIMRCVLHEKKTWIYDMISKIDMTTFIDKLQKKIYAEVSGLITQSLYLLCTLANLDEKFHELILKTDLIKRGVILLDENNDDMVKISVMNFILNMLWKPKGDTELGRKLFKEFNIEEKLNKLIKGEKNEVSFKAAQTLAYFN